MRKFIRLEDQDNICKQNGEYKKLAYVNRQQIISLLENAQISINSANLIASSIDEKDHRWMTVYTGYYEALHILAEAFLQFEKIKVALISDVIFDIISPLL